MIAKRKMVSLRLPEDIAEAIKLAAWADRTTQSAIITDLVEHSYIKTVADRIREEKQKYDSQTKQQAP